MKFKLLEKVLTSFTHTTPYGGKGHYFIYVNPTSQELKSKEDSKWNRAMIDVEGNLYMEAKWLGKDAENTSPTSYENDIIHEYLVDELKKIGKFTDFPDDWYNNPESLKFGVAIERKEDTFTFYISESYEDWGNMDWVESGINVEKQLKHLFKLAKKKNPFLRFSMNSILFH